MALAVSMVGNLFAVGIIAGGLLTLSQERRPHPGLHPGLHPGMRKAGIELPQPDRHRFNAMIRRVIAADLPLIDLARSNRRDAADLFVRPQFDAIAVAADLDRARQADFDLRAGLERAAIDFAVGLPAEEREMLARGLERGGPLHNAGPLAQPPVP